MTWQIVPDTSSGDREGSIADGGDWRVEFGGQSVMKTKTRPSAVAVERRDQLVGRIRR